MIISGQGRGSNPDILIYHFRAGGEKRTVVTSRFMVLLLLMVLLAVPGRAEDLKRHGPYRVGMPFQEFVDVLRGQIARTTIEVNPRGALFRTHAPLGPFRIYTFAPFYVDPRLTEEFVFNDGRLIAVVTRERLKESPFVRGDDSEKEKSKKKRKAAAAKGQPRLSKSGRDLRDRLFDRFGRGKVTRGPRGMVFSWRRAGTLISYALLQSGERAFLEKTLVAERERQVLYSGAGDYRTNLEVDALNNRVFRAPPAGAREATWQSGRYPYKVGPCEGYRGPLDLFGCTLRLNFGESESAK